MKKFRMRRLIADDGSVLEEFLQHKVLDKKIRELCLLAEKNNWHSLDFSTLVHSKMQFLLALSVVERKYRVSKGVKK